MDGASAVAYDLEDLAALRVERALRPIEPTGYHEDELRREIMRAVRYQRQVTTASIIPMIAESASAIAIEAALTSLREGTANPLQVAERAVRDLVDRIADWHDARWKVVARAGTGVDLSNLINRDTIRPQMEAALRRNVALIRNVAEDTLVRVERATWDAFENSRPMSDYRRDLREQFDFSRKRANLIARDQMGKMTGSLDEARHTEAGIKSYIWSTSRDNRVRAAHRAREGLTFRWRSPPSDGHPGVAISCRCKAKAVLKPKNPAAATGNPGNTPPKEFDGWTQAEMDEAIAGAYRFNPRSQAIIDGLDPITSVPRHTGQAWYHGDSRSMMMARHWYGNEGGAAVLRHELGHAVDYQYGARLGQRTLSEDVIRRANADVEVMDLAASRSAATTLINDIAKRPGTFNADRSINYQSVSNALGLDRNLRIRLTQLIKNETDRSTFAVSVATRDPSQIKQLVENIVGRNGITKGESAEFFNFSDFINAISKGRHGDGGGHTKAYYDQFKPLFNDYTEGHALEAFANWFSLTQGPNGSSWSAVMAEFAPGFHRRALEVLDEAVAKGRAAR